MCLICVCRELLSFAQLAKRKRLGRSKPATNSQAQALATHCVEYSTISMSYRTAFYRNKMSTTRCEWVRLFISRQSSLHIHCKKSWRKTPPAWPDVTDSLVRGTETFFYMKIELIRRVPTMKTKYFEISEIFQRLIWRLLTNMTEFFEINRIFRRFSDLTRRRFPTIFRQLSNNLSKSKQLCRWFRFAQLAKGKKSRP